jgi:hypothetical protein
MRILRIGAIVAKHCKLCAIESNKQIVFVEILSNKPTASKEYGFTHLYTQDGAARAEPQHRIHLESKAVRIQLEQYVACFTKVEKRLPEKPRPTAGPLCIPGAEPAVDHNKFHQVRRKNRLWWNPIAIRREPGCLFCAAHLLRREQYPGNVLADGGVPRAARVQPWHCRLVHSTGEAEQ